MWVSFWFYREENDDRCGGSPLILNLMFCLGYVFLIFVSGRLHRVDVCFILSFSPLLFSVLVITIFNSLVVGEITQGVCKLYTLVLPSLKPVLDYFSF